MKNKKKPTETEQEKSMYAICFSILAICLVLLLFLSDNTPLSMFKGSITGAVVEETRNLTPTIVEEKVYISYENISFGNITQELALNAILQAEEDMREMQETGFGVAWVNDSLIEAKKYFEGEDYTALLKQIEEINDTERQEKAKALLIKAQERIGVPVDYKLVLEKTKAIHERKKRAYEINDLIRASELRIEEFKQQGLDTLEVEEILSNAVVEFKDERFETAGDLLENIGGKLIEIRTEATLVRTIYRAGKENIGVFLKEHYKPLLLLLGSLLVIVILLYNRIMITILRRKIKEMKVEKDILLELMKKAQSDYFAKADITKQTFEIKISKYKEGLVELKQKLPVAEALLKKRLKSKRVI